MIAITCLIINLDWILNKQSEMGYRRQITYLECALRRNMHGHGGARQGRGGS